MFQGKMERQKYILNDPLISVYLLTDLFKSFDFSAYSGVAKGG